MAKNTVLDSASFSLIRTDARLTGNIKLTVDSSGALWLNTIDGNDFLSNDNYKHSAVIDGWSHPMNISRFLSADTENAIKLLYDVRQDVDPNMIADNLEYEHQYDFSEYFAGAKYLKSPHYSEKMSYFAPIYLNGTDIPEYFIILKVDGAINGNLIDIINNKEAAYAPQEYMYEILSRSTIIKTFDMGISSRIGMYLRRMVNDPNFPGTGLKVNFNEGMFTKWCGISIADGVYSDAGELLHDFYSERKPLKIFEEYITNGYKRHGLLHPNIINLEFLFNDNTSDVFDHNRYIGFYVNQCELSKFMTLASKQSQIQEIVGNYPNIYPDIHQYRCINAEISNDSGVCISVVDSDMSKDTADYLTQSKERQIIPYVKDKRGNFHEVKEYSFDYTGKLDYIRVKDKKIQYCDFVGSDDIQVVNDYAKNDDRYEQSFVYMKFNDIPSSGDYILVYHLNGTHIDDDGRRFDKIFFNSYKGADYLYCGDYYSMLNVYDTNQTDFTEYSYKGEYSEESVLLLEKAGDYLELSKPSKYNSEFALMEIKNDLSDDELGDIIVKINTEIIFTNKNHVNLENHNYYFVGSCGGYQHLDKFSEGLAACVNTIPNSPFLAYGNNGEFIIVYQAGGDFDGTFGVEPHIGDSNLYEILGKKSGDDNIYWSFGGSNNKNTVVIDRIHENVLSGNNCVRMDTYHSKIEKVGRVTTEFSSNMDKEQVRSAFASFNNSIALILSDDDPALLADNKCYITSLYEAKIGCFSFYRIKDFDFDDFSTRYSEMTYWDKYKYMVPAGVKYLSPYIIYEIPDAAFSVTCDGCDVKDIRGDGHYFSIDPIDGSTDEYYSYEANISEDTYVIPCLYVLDENGEKTTDFDTYIDISSFGSKNESSVIYINDDEESHINDASPLLNDVKCEYDYYNENYYVNDSNRDGALVQYVCKWAMKNGLDAFNNPYRLNTSDVFGINNLSPEDTNTVDVNSYSNNWMYLVSNVYQSIDNYCYINKPFPVDIESSGFNFDDYFTLYVNGTYRYLYSPVTYNKVTGVCETFFRGKKLVINMYDENGALVTGDAKYDGYKFSALLVPRKIDQENKPIRPVDYVFRVDDDQKYMLYYVNLYLDDNTANKNINDNLNAETLVGGNYTYMCLYEEFLQSKSDYIPQGYYILFEKDYDKVDINGNIFDDVKAGSILLCLGNFGDVIDEYDPASGSESGSGSGSDDYSYQVTLTSSVYRMYTRNDMLNEGVFNSHITNLYSDDSNPRIDGDYRISFDSRGVCSLTYSDIYEFKSKKFGRLSGQYSTINIPLEFKLMDQSSVISIRSYPTHYEPNLYSIINTLDPNKPFVIEYDTHNGKAYDTICTYFNGNNDYPLPIRIALSSDNQYLYTNYDLCKSFVGIRRFNLYDGKYKVSMYNTQSNMYQVCGGLDYYSNNLFKLINFKSLINALTNDSSGLLIYDTKERISISEEIPSVIKTKKYIGISPVYNTGGGDVLIGSTYDITDRKTQTSLDNFEYLYRYSGNYDPIFVDVINFGSDKDMYNIFFNSSDESFGVIRNYPHLKVSKGSVIDDSISKSSVLTGNNTVGYSDMNILNTSWDLDFHKKYISELEYENVPGTLRIQEDDTYVNNIIILPDSFTLTKFDAEPVSDVYSVNMSEKEIVYSISNNDLYVRVNYKNVITKKLIDMGIYKAFESIDTKYNDTILGTDINSYIVEYIEENILKMYGIDKSYVYYSINNDVVSISSEEFDGYGDENVVVDTNVKIKDCGNYMVEFVYHLNGKYRPKINFVMDMKLI